MKPIACYCGRVNPLYWEVRTPSGREIFTTKKEALAFIKSMEEKE